MTERQQVHVEALATPGDVACFAADEVARAVARRGDARIVLPAGATPIPMYGELVRRCLNSELDLSSAHLFQLDELVGVGQEDPRSFSSFLGEHLLEAVDRRESRDHRIDGSAVEPADEARRHGQRLADLGGADLVLLGLGQNGHLAFNEPGSSVEDGARVVELHESTVRALGASFGPDEMPRQGVTLGMREILAGLRIVLLVTGGSKASVLRRALEGPPDRACPASLIRSHPGLTILADRDALQ